QIAVGRVRDAAPLRPLPDRVELDPDQGGQVRAPVADDDRLLDVRGGFQRVLDLAGCHVLPAGRDDDVLGAVGDAQMRAVHEGPDVAGPQPAVGGERRPGGGRVAEVPGERAGVAGLDLAVVGDAHLDAGVYLADGAEPDPAGPVGGGD